jgi:hypothetical protein
MRVIPGQPNAACEPDKIGYQKQSQSLRQRKTSIGKMAKEVVSKRKTAPTEQKNIHIPDKNRRESYTHVFINIP